MNGAAPVWSVDIKKIDPEQRRVFGFGIISQTSDGQPVVDLQGDYAPPDEMEEAAYDFCKNVRTGGEMHEGPARATLIESMAFTPEKLAALGIPAGSVPTAHWVGFEVPPESFDRVKRGELKMFSIEGSADRVAA